MRSQGCVAMSGNRRLQFAVLYGWLWLVMVLVGADSASAHSAGQNRSLYARQGQFTSRTTDYRPAWKVHPNVRPPRTAQRGNSHPVRQTRYQQDILEPPFGEEDATPPFDEIESAAPPEVEDPASSMFETEPEAEEIPSAPARQTPAQQAPVQTPSRNGGASRQPTLAPAPPADLEESTEPIYERIPAPRPVPRPKAKRDFEYQTPEQYGYPAEEYEEYGGEYADDGMHFDETCPDCGQHSEYCDCGPPDVCNDTWPCWHARRQWGRFRLFGGGWDIGCPWNWWDELSLFAGPHSFKGPLDQGRNGNFGFQEGVNWGGPLWHCHGIGFQLGAQGVHSNFAGYDVNGSPSDDNRNQAFATAGIFTRAPNGHGWQVGVAFDWLQDDYYVDVALDQVRAELSYVTFCGTELGGWIASSSSTDEDTNNGMMYEVTDMYALFIRHTVPSGGEGRLWGGGTGDGNGLVGADFNIPLTNRWALAGAVNYIIAQDGAGQEGLSEEAWGMTINLVWHPFRPRHGCNTNGQYRPLFSVADNTVFMVDREVGE